MSEIAIKVENISKLYKLYEKPIDRLKESLSISKKIYHKNHYALQNVSFELKKGENVAIIGLNGAGKSTLLKIITGVLNQTNGYLSIDGKISALLELGAGFNPEYTGIENIYLNGTMMGYSREQINKKINDIAEFADIGEFIYQPVKTYSSGMFARLAFAVAVNVEPEILIVDEALSVGDIFFQQKCNQYMKEKMELATKIIVTHDMHTVANMADRVILLEKGSIIFDGDVQKGIETYLKKVHNNTFTSKVQDDKGISNIKKDVNLKSIKKEIDFKEVDDDNIAGARDVVITHFKYTVNDMSSQIIKADDKLNIRFIIYSKKDISNMIIGYTFKDKYGNSIFAQNTLGQRVYIEKSIFENCKYEVSLDIIWPEIKEGDYFLTLGIGEGYNEMIHNIQCWAHNIIHLSSISEIPMHGIINHSIEKMRIVKIEGE